MDYKTTKEQLMILHPTLFPNEAELLHHMFFVNGNGLEWVNGELVDPTLKTFDEELVISKVWEAKGRVKYKADCDKTDQLYIDNGCDPPNHKSYDDLFLNPRVSAKIYPISQYSRVMRLPENITSDWLSASEKAMVVADGLIRTDEDDEWLAIAQGRIDTLKMQRANSSTIDDNI